MLAHDTKILPSALTSDWARLEREAGEATRRVEGRVTPIPALEVAEGGAGAPRPAGGGRPLPAAERQVYEARFGRDFSQVRVHGDAPAAELAEQASARAITRGNDIFFGPGEYDPQRAGGEELLGHELAHVVQQQGAAGAPLQAEPKPGPKGIGSVAPKEPFSIGKGVGAEESSVQFELDSADISAATEKRLVESAAGYATPVVLEVNGYASAEGDSTYNINLSAYRALAVKSILLARLAPGSEVRVIARGETSAFGAAENNRHVGIHLLPGAAPAATELGKGTPAGKEEGKPEDKKEGGWTFDPRRKQPTILLPGLNYTPPTLGTGGPGGPYSVPPSFYSANPPRGTGLLDWSEMRDPFTTRGIALGDRDIAGIEKNWKVSYDFFRSLGLSPDLAAWGANKGTAYAYDDFLSREQPNSMDHFKAEDEKAKALLAPNLKETKTPNIPVITPTTLKWVTKKLFNKDVDFTF